MRRTATITLITLLAAPGFAHAAKWYVDINNVSGTEDGTTWATAFTTIQQGIDAAAATGDEVVVAPGDYVQTLSMSGKDLFMRSTNPSDPDVVAATVIRDSGGGACIYFTGSETRDCEVAGFTILGGAYGVYGNDTLAVLRDNDITGNNTAGIAFFNGVISDCYVRDTAGVGLYYCGGVVARNIIERNHGGGLSNCAATIASNIIRANSTGNNNGGGLFNCDGLITRNRIYQNNAYMGGGLYNCDGILVNNFVFQNSAYYGGGMASSSGRIRHNTIYGNTAYSGGGLYVCSKLIQNSIVWGNTADFDPQIAASATPSYSCIQGWPGGGTGNISDDPRLFNPEAGDLHLKLDSPCIDAAGLAGRAGSDIDLQLRPFDGFPGPRGDGSDYDMGADEVVGLTDTDADGISDADEGLDDSDLDTIPDYLDSDSDNDGTSDALEGRGDSDNDGVPDFQDADPAATGRTITVGPAGDFNTIQGAIDRAAFGDTIIVSPGTYSGGVSFLGKRIDLTSTDPTNPTVVASTIIDGDGVYNIVTFMGYEPASTVLEGFTITDGTYGIFGNGCTATIRNNVVQGTIYGGAMACDGLIESNVFRTATSGYGLYLCQGLIQNNEVSENVIGLVSCNGTIQNNDIHDNHNPGEPGGGLQSCAGIITDNRIYANEASLGGGIFGATGMVTGNEIFNNEAQYGGGIGACHGVIEDNVIYGNSAFFGGGIGIAGGSIRLNTIYGNTVTDGGGGLYDCSGSVWQNTVYGNSATGGGGGAYSNGEFVNNLIFDNSAVEAGGILSGSGLLAHNTIHGNAASSVGGGISQHNGDMENNIVWGNTAPLDAQIHDSSMPTYSCIENWSGGGVGNIATDPMLHVDLHLLEGSPCMNTGGASSIGIDFDTEARPHGVGPDIGADEYIDTDGDGIPDYWEVFYGSNPSVPDTGGDDDDDSLDNLEEYQAGTNPNEQDTDGDGFRDDREIEQGSDPLQGNSKPNEVWVDLSFSGAEDGSQLRPFNSLSEAVTAATPGMTIVGMAGASSETLRITKPLRIESLGGPFRVGV